MARRVRFFRPIEKEKDPIPMRPLYDSAPLITVVHGLHRLDELGTVLTEHETRLTRMTRIQHFDREIETVDRGRHVWGRLPCFLTEWVVPASLRMSAVLIHLSGPRTISDIRTSFDDSAAPFSSMTIKRVNIPRRQSIRSRVGILVLSYTPAYFPAGSLLEPLIAPASPLSNVSSGVFFAVTST